MAYITRALRRRLLWTLVAAALGAATLTGCNDKPQPAPASPPAQGPVQEPPSTGSQSDTATVLAELRRISTSWLSEVGDRSTTVLGCPQTEFELAMTGADAGDLQACLLPTGNQWILQVRNRTGVPITVSGPDILLWTVPPNGTVDIHLARVHVFEEFKFMPNVAAGVSMALVDKLSHRPVFPGLEWLQCAAQQDTGCLAEKAAGLLGDVRVADVNVPVGGIASLLIELYEQRSLINAFVGHATGQEGGSLIVQQA
jgi:hypothetical protein